MLALEEQFIIDEGGNRIAVILGIDNYKKLLEELEELEAICAYDKVKASNDEIISCEQAVEEIKRDRQ